MFRRANFSKAKQAPQKLGASAGLGKPGGLKVIDANGQSFAYVYSRENANDARIASLTVGRAGRRAVYQ
jgi:hypothetical protein